MGLMLGNDMGKMISQLQEVIEKKLQTREGVAELLGAHRKTLNQVAGEFPDLFGPVAQLMDRTLERAVELLTSGMKNEKIISAFKACEDRLRDHEVPGRRGDRGGYWPRQDGSSGDKALWCAVEGPKLLAEGRREKAMRWLGFVQGVTFALGLCTVEDLKNDSRPDEEKADAGTG